MIVVLKSFSCLIFFLLSGSVWSQTIPLTIKYSCTEINQGYDYEFKIKLLVDNKIIGESQPHLSSKANQATFYVPTGTHFIRIIGYKNFNGNWEESLISKGYTVDSKYEQTVTLTGPANIELLFQLTTGTLTRGFVIGSTSSNSGSADNPQIPQIPK